MVIVFLNATFLQVELGNLLTEIESQIFGKEHFGEDLPILKQPSKKLLEDGKISIQTPGKLSPANQSSILGC